MASVSNTAKYCIIKVYLQNIHHNNICTSVNMRTNKLGYH